MKRLGILFAILLVVFSVRFVLAQTCNADFTYDANCPTQFTDQSTSSTGTINSWLWNFGDGNFSSLPSPLNTYAANGSYSVFLQIWTTDSCFSSVAQTVTINCVPVELQSYSVE